MIAIRQWLIDHIFDITLAGLVCYFLFQQRQIVIHYCPKVETHMPSTHYPFHI